MITDAVPCRLLAAPNEWRPADRRNTRSRQALVERVTAEFEEMPCLRLTAPQARRLFGLAPDITDRVLAKLVRDGVLTKGSDGRYMLRSDDSTRLPTTH